MIKDATHSTTLFSPLCSNSIPVGNTFVDVVDIAEVGTFSETRVLSMVACFRETHGHFIATVSYPQYMGARQGG